MSKISSGGAYPQKSKKKHHLPPAPRLPRLEKHAIISSLLEQGLTRQEICDKLGWNYSTVTNILQDPDGSKMKARKEARKEPCIDCRKLISRSDGKRNPKRCAACSQAFQASQKRWTREAIIEAIQLFAERNGRPPLATEWLKSKAVRGEDYPPASAVYQYKGQLGRKNPFPSWADAIEAAGFPRPKRGHKVLTYGQGVANSMADEYVVFALEEDGRWSLHETEAATADLAIEKIAFREGTYFPIKKKVFNSRDVKPKMVFTVMDSTPGGDEES